MKENKWNDCLELGDLGERFTKTNFFDLFKPILEQFLYANRFKYGLQEAIKEQHEGKDGSIQVNLFKWETKTRDKSFRRFNDILLETISMVEYNKEGWFFNVPKKS